MAKLSWWSKIKTLLNRPLAFPFQSERPASKPSREKAKPKEKKITTQAQPKSSQKSATPRPSIKPKQKGIVRSELNLEKHGVFVPSTFRRKSWTHTQIERTEDGKELKRTIEVGVRGKAKVGVLRISSHFRTCLVLQKLWDDTGRPPDKILENTFYQICRLLKIDPNPRSYEKLKNDLLELKEIPIHFFNYWYDKKTGTYIEDLESFSILEKCRIIGMTEKEKKKAKAKGEKVIAKVIWKFHPNITQSLLANHSHPALLSAVTSIKKHKDLGTMWYLFADRQLTYKAFGESVERTLPNLWQETVGYIPKYTKKADWKKKALPVLRVIKDLPLSSGGILEVKLTLTTDKTAYKVIFTKKAAPKPISQPKGKAPPQLPEGRQSTPEEEKEALEAIAEMRKELEKKDIIQPKQEPPPKPKPLTKKEQEIVEACFEKSKGQLARQAIENIIKHSKARGKSLNQLKDELDRWLREIEQARQEDKPKE